MGGLRTFLSELRRRKIWLVGGVYTISAWIVAQVASLVLPNFAAPGWVMPVLLIVLGLGLPLAIILAWAQETQAADGAEPAIDTEPIANKGMSIAVLPFDNLSGEDEFGYLADGLVDEVITILAQNPRFFVIARNTTFTYKGQAVNVQDVGRELGVTYVIEGSVRKAGQQMRINVQLIEASTGAHAWSDRFVFDADEIFDIQDQVIEGIAGHLGDEVLAAEISRLSKRPTDDLGAWELYVRSIDWRRTGAKAAVTHLRQALKRDPEFAIATAMLAEILAAALQLRLPEDAEHAEIRALAERALLLAPRDPLVSAAVANALSLIGEHERANQLAESVKRTASGDAGILAVQAVVKMRSGEAAEAVRLAERVLELSPRDMAMSGFLNILTLAHIQLGNLESALNYCKDALSFSGSGEQMWTSRINMANLLGLRGELDEARRLVDLARKEYPDADLNAFVQHRKTCMVDTAAVAGLEGLQKAGIIQ